MLFADDLQIIIQCKPYEIEDNNLKFNKDGNCLVDWAIVRGIDMHFDKTTAMQLGSVQQLRFINTRVLYPIIIGNHIILPVPSVQNLGLTMFSN